MDRMEWRRGFVMLLKTACKLKPMLLSGSDYSVCQTHLIAGHLKQRKLYHKRYNDCILQNKSKTHKTELECLRDILRNNTLTIQVMKWEMVSAPKKKQRRVFFYQKNVHYQKATNQVLNKSQKV